VEDRALATLIVSSVLLVACGETRLPYESCRPGRDQCLPTDYGAETSCVEWCGNDRYACIPVEGRPPPDYTPECLVDGVCRPEDCEDLWNCWEDCHLECDEERLTAGPSTAFLVSAVHADASDMVQSHEEYSVDLNGDAYPDNKLGKLIASWMQPAETGEPDRAYAEAIASGRMLLVMQFFPPGPTADGITLVRFQAARIEGDASPLLDGTDRVVLDPESALGGKLCGRWDQDRLVTDPSIAPLVLPLPLADDSGGYRTAHLEGAQIQGTIDATGIRRMILAGGVPTSEARVILIDAMLEGLNARLAQDPEDEFARFFDGHCSTYIDLPECYSATAGEGDCAEDLVVTWLELQCHSAIDQAASPDLRLPYRFGTEPRLSLGVQIDAVPVMIVE
jgi:hypothetical protein